MIRTAVIVQARMTSSRLPGKMMMPIAGRPLLAHVLERVKKIKQADIVILAVPASDISTPLRDVASSFNVVTFTGSEHDVLDRYYMAAKAHDPTVIVRITGDCPLIDPEVCDEVISLRRRHHAEYASNVHPRSFPKGLDCEVFTRLALNRAKQAATDGHDKEHVTPWIIRNYPKLNLPSGKFNLAKLNWCVDTQEDLERVNGMIEADSVLDFRKLAA